MNKAHAILANIHLQLAAYWLKHARECIVSHRVAASQSARQAAQPHLAAVKYHREASCH